jgi:hypothetical protein
LSSAMAVHSIPAAIPADADDMKRIPFWVDFDGKVNRATWLKVLSIVLHAASLWSGTTVERLVWIMSRFLDTWEVELLIGWLVNVGAVEFVDGKGEGGGLIAREWWWMAMAA